jgi:hypothetical protein
MQKKAKHKTNKKQNNYNIKKEEGYLVVVIKKSKRLTIGTMHPVRYLYRTGYYQV